MLLILLDFNVRLLSFHYVIFETEAIDEEKKKSLLLYYKYWKKIKMRDVKDIYVLLENI